MKYVYLGFAVSNFLFALNAARIGATSLFVVNSIAAGLCGFFAWKEFSSEGKSK